VSRFKEFSAGSAFFKLLGHVEKLDIEHRFVVPAKRRASRNLYINRLLAIDVSRFKEFSAGSAFFKLLGHVARRYFCLCFLALAHLCGYSLGLSFCDGGDFLSASVCMTMLTTRALLTRT
jgi:hypothetical protein